jgi:hypothetical protein
MTLFRWPRALSAAVLSLSVLMVPGCDDGASGGSTVDGGGDASEDGAGGAGRGVAESDAEVVEPDAAVPEVDAALVAPDAAVPELDAALVAPDASVSEPDAAAAESDAAAAEPDAAALEPDAAAAEPDAAVIQPDAAMVEPDAAMVEPDAAMVEPDAAMQETDAAVIEPDAAMVEPDAAAVEPDAAVVVENLPPLPATVSLSAPDGAEGQLTCIVEVAARDADPLVETFSWTINGLQHMETGPTLPADEVRHCDVITCELTVSDGVFETSSNTAEIALPFGVDCDDDEICTTDGCAVGGGCDPVPNALECDDGDACTVGDVCADGACVPGAARDCRDDLFCNGEEVCDPVDGCLPGEPPELDDGVDCTDGRCDEEADVVVQDPQDAACASDNPCAAPRCTLQGCVVEPVENRTPCAEDRTRWCRDGECVPASNAWWLSGGWGIGYRIAPGRHPEVLTYDVDGFVDQIRALGAAWVIVNITAASHGDEYTAPHSVLSVVNPTSTPEARDLFGEIATALQAAGVRVIAYVATQGPTMLKHGPTRAYDWNGVNAPSIDNWMAWVLEAYGANDDAALKQAFAETIIAEYAERYGALVDGWWFDHSGFGDVPRLHAAVMAGNPDAAIAFNDGQKVPLTNNHPGYEAFTSGHPTPVQQMPAPSAVNLPMITSIEGTPEGYFIVDGALSLGHVFMPVATRWNSGSLVWTVEQAAEWQARTMAGHGAWSWNLPRDPTEPSLLDRGFVDFVEQVLAAMDEAP